MIELAKSAAPLVAIACLAPFGYGRRSLWFGLLLGSFLLLVLTGSVPGNRYYNIGTWGTSFFFGSSLGLLVASVIYRPRRRFARGR
jgi:hypothetical protein